MFERNRTRQKNNHTNKRGFVKLPQRNVSSVTCKVLTVERFSFPYKASQHVRKECCYSRAINLTWTWGVIALKTRAIRSLRTLCSSPPQLSLHKARITSTLHIKFTSRGAHKTWVSLHFIRWSFTQGFGNYTMNGYCMSNWNVVSKEGEHNESSKNKHTTVLSTFELCEHRWRRQAFVSQWNKNLLLDSTFGLLLHDFRRIRLMMQNPMIFKPPNLLNGLLSNKSTCHMYSS